MIRFIGRILLLLIVISIIAWLINAFNTNAPVKNEDSQPPTTMNSDTKDVNTEEIMAQIGEISNDILNKNGFAYIAKMRSGMEAFAKCIHETFTLVSDTSDYDIRLYMFDFIEKLKKLFPER